MAARDERSPAPARALFALSVASLFFFCLWDGNLLRQLWHLDRRSDTHDQGAVAVPSDSASPVPVKTSEASEARLSVDGPHVNVSYSVISASRARALLEEATSSSEAELKALIAQKMVPRELVSRDGGSLARRQFLHLHHMKTGGTSMDRKLSCAISRMRRMGATASYYSLHECSHSHYERCKSGQDENCQKQMHESALISYCAPLKDLPLFGWDAYQTAHDRRLLPDGTADGVILDQARRPVPEGQPVEDQSDDSKEEEEEVERIPIPETTSVEDVAEVQREPIPEAEGAAVDKPEAVATQPLKSATVAPYDSVTVLRNPVERVWSMFRFQTRNCYDCRNLTSIFQSVDVGKGNEKIDRLCLKQLLNHQTANLLSSASSGDPSRQDLTEEEEDQMVKEAIHNMQNFFTVIGLTEQLPKTVELVDNVFPWLAEKIPGSEKTCPLPHANASPSNNRCAPGYKHWDLPDHPDEETTKAIIAHNKLDMKLYTAATQLFQIQWQVYEEGKTSG